MITDIDMMLKLILTILFIGISLNGIAQKVIADLRNVAPPGLLNLEIKTFTDNDSIYYLKFNTRSQKPGEFYFMFLTPERTWTIARYGRNTSQRRYTNVTVTQPRRALASYLRGVNIPSNII